MFRALASQPGARPDDCAHPTLDPSRRRRAECPWECQLRAGFSRARDGRGRCERRWSGSTAQSSPGTRQARLEPRRCDRGTEQRRCGIRSDRPTTRRLNACGRWRVERALLGTNGAAYICVRMVRHSPSSRGSVIRDIHGCACAGPATNRRASSYRLGVGRAKPSVPRSIASRRRRRGQRRRNGRGSPGQNWARRCCHHRS